MLPFSYRTTRGFTWDAFDRPLKTTLKRPEDNEPGLLSVHSYDGFTGPNVHYGRSVKVRTYTDPLASNDTSTIEREGADRARTEPGLMEGREE